jgi:RimJ/RimL family protein N-acetyltransferase
MAAQLSNSASQPVTLAVAPAHALSDDEISLAPMLPHDFSLLFTWLNDADAAALDVPYMPVSCLAYRDWLEKIARDSSQLLFSVRRHGGSEQALGFILFKNFQTVYRSAELGARIGQESERGHGYGKRAVRLALSYAWNTLNLHRVSLHVFADNQRALTCYRNAGMVQEGLMRDGAFTGGKWRDVALMAALRPHEPGC